MAMKEILARLAAELLWELQQTRVAQELVTTRAARALLMPAAVAVVVQDTVMPAKHLDQQEAVQPVKDIRAGLVVTITDPRKAHTTVEAVVVAQEHKDTIVADDTDKPVAVKDKLAVLAAP